MRAPRLGLRGLMWAGVFWSLAGATYAAWTEGITYDEPYHLQWSETLLQTGSTSRVEQRLNSKTPIMLPSVLARRGLQALSISDPNVLLFGARLPTVGWLGALLGATFWLCRRLFGETAARLATLAASLDPNLVAHGSLATSDVAYALATLLTLGAGLFFWERPSLGRAIALGLAIGFAFTAKFTAVLLGGTLFALPLVSQRSEGTEPGQARRLLVLLAFVIIVADALICASYLFKEIAAPIGTLAWRSQTMLKASQAFPGLRLPVPAGFLTGLDASRASERGEIWNPILLGRNHPGGVWYYFAFLWLVKTPLLVLLAELGGLWVFRRSFLNSPKARFVLFVMGVHLVYFSCFFRTQIGFRFVLMCVPLAYILSAAGLAPFLSRKKALGTAIVIVALLENSLYWGNPLSFTNAAVWPKKQVFRLLADSNVDWGQNREKIGLWLAQNGAAESHLEPLHMLPGHNTYDLNTLSGLWDFERHRWLREHADPMGHFGHTYLWFDIEYSLFDRFMNEKRRLHAGNVGTLCSAPTEYEHLGPGARRDFSIPEGGGPSEWIVCVETRHVDFGLRDLSGSMRFGPYRNGICAPEEMGPGQVLWYRLDPGVHAFCAAEITARRPWLPRGAEGRWLFRDGAASFGIRQREASGLPTPAMP